MKYSSKYFKQLDLIRILSCIAILLYHLGILKGGYLAVCIFFVLSGYLSSIAAFSKEKFSLKSYYYNKFIHIYIPLLIVVFISIYIISLIPSISWLNLKPETTSVIFGYNNFWQLSANLDYFARHINSPFMHLWYISILLQFILVFPFIFIGLKKLGDKFSKIIPCLLPLILGITSCIYFYFTSLNGNIMVAYYNTFTRVFSLLFGVSLGFVHYYYRSLIPQKLRNKTASIVVFYTYLISLIFLSIFIDAKSELFQISMILVTLITCRLIDYGVLIVKSELNIFERFIKFVSGITYEIYLVQYPIIFLLQNIAIPHKTIFTIFIILIVSILIHFSINLKKDRFKLLKCITISLISITCICGTYEYIIAEDHTAEMKALEDQLKQNEKMLQKKQEEYALKLEKEKEDLATKMASLEVDEDELKEIVTNLPVIGLGDSVMLGAVGNLYNQFPNGYFDAKISRTAYVANGMLKELENNNMLGDPIVFNFGANGDCPDAYKVEIMNTCGNRKVFWINVTNDKDVHVNDSLDEFASQYPNLHIIDWDSISNGHPDYFYADGIHLTESGRVAYTDAIYKAIYDVYLKDYEEQKQKLLKDYEEAQKTKISFYGNDILINAFDYLADDFENAEFKTDKSFNYIKLKEHLIKDIESGILSNKVVFVFDNSIMLSVKQYKELIDLCSGHEIYILSSDNVVDNLDYEKVKIVNLYEKINSHAEYLMIDNIHLTDLGNKALKQILKETINN